MEIDFRGDDVSASGYYAENYEPRLVKDGVLSSKNKFFFHAAGSEHFAWLMVDLLYDSLVTAVTTVTRKDCCTKRYRDVQVCWEIIHGDNRLLSSLFDILQVRIGSTAITSIGQILTVNEPCDGPENINGLRSHPTTDFYDSQANPTTDVNGFPVYHYLCEPELSGRYVTVQTIGSSIDWDINEIYIYQGFSFQ